MDLFSDQYDGQVNCLPFDGQVNYYGTVMSAQQADEFFTQLYQQVAWRQDQAIANGQLIHTRRRIAWYGDKPYSYTYSSITKTALPWLPCMLELKQLIEQHTGESFNACLVNLYNDGQDGMAWHSDGEMDLKQHGAIASLSFGAERVFAFKHKSSGHKVSLPLAPGSLLVMAGTTQENWLHRLPPTTKVSEPRINLTFRTIVRQNPSWQT